MFPDPLRCSRMIFLPAFSLFVGCTTPPAKLAPIQTITTTVEVPTDLEREVRLYHLHLNGTSPQLKISYYKDSHLPPELLYTSDDTSTSCNSTSTSSDPFDSFRLLFQKFLQTSNPEVQYSLYMPCYPQVDARMTALAAAEPPWQTLQQKNSSPSVVYAFLGTLLTTSGINQELSHALVNTGYTAQVDPKSLEKLWTTVPSRLTPQQRMYIHEPLRSDVALPTAISKAFMLVKKSER